MSSSVSGYFPTGRPIGNNGVIGHSAVLTINWDPELLQSSNQTWPYICVTGNGEALWAGMTHYCTYTVGKDGYAIITGEFDDVIFHMGNDPEVKLRDSGTAAVITNRAIKISGAASASVTVAYEAPVAEYRAVEFLAGRPSGLYLALGLTGNCVRHVTGTFNHTRDVMIKQDNEPDGTLNPANIIPIMDHITRPGGTVEAYGTLLGSGEMMANVSFSDADWPTYSNPSDPTEVGSDSLSIYYGHGGDGTLVSQSRTCSLSWGVTMSPTIKGLYSLFDEETPISHPIIDAQGLPVSATGPTCEISGTGRLLSFGNSGEIRRDVPVNPYLSHSGEYYMMSGAGTTDNNGQNAIASPLSLSHQVDVEASDDMYWIKQRREDLSEYVSEQSETVIKLLDPSYPTTLDALRVEKLDHFDLSPAGSSTGWTVASGTGSISLANDPAGVYSKKFINTSNAVFSLPVNRPGKFFRHLRFTHYGSDQEFDIVVGSSVYHISSGTYKTGFVSTSQWQTHRTIDLDLSADPSGTRRGELPGQISSIEIRNLPSGDFYLGLVNLCSFSDGGYSGMQLYHLEMPNNVVNNPAYTSDEGSGYYGNSSIVGFTEGCVSLVVPTMLYLPSAKSYQPLTVQDVYDRILQQLGENGFGWELEMLLPSGSGHYSAENALAVWLDESLGGSTTVLRLEPTYDYIYTYPDDWWIDGRLRMHGLIHGVAWDTVNDVPLCNEQIQLHRTCPKHGSELTPIYSDPSSPNYGIFTVEDVKPGWWMSGEVQSNGDPAPETDTLWVTPDNQTRVAMAPRQIRSLLVKPLSVSSWVLKCFALDGRLVCNSSGKLVVGKSS